MRYFLSTFLVVCITLLSGAQQVEVRADYDPDGNCLFSAYNNTPAPIFLKLNFADLQNTYFSGPLPFIQKLEPGYNDLFTLPRELSGDVPRFNYEISVVHSTPTPTIDLDFPYLLPFTPGSKVSTCELRDTLLLPDFEQRTEITGTNFVTQPNTPVLACRKGIIIAIQPYSRQKSKLAYALTMLQPDGTLIAYYPVSIAPTQAKTGKTIYPGQTIGTTTSANLKIVIYYKSLATQQIAFVVPQFVIKEKHTEILHSGQVYTIIHPPHVLHLEMSKKEQRRAFKQ